MRLSLSSPGTVTALVRAPAFGVALQHRIWMTVYAR